MHCSSGIITYPTCACRSHDNGPVAVKAWEAIQAGDGAAGGSRVCSRERGATEEEQGEEPCNLSKCRQLPSCLQLPSGLPAMLTNPKPLGRPVSRSVITRALQADQGRSAAYRAAAVTNAHTMHEQGSVGVQANQNPILCATHLTTGPKRANSRARACSSTFGGRLPT